MKQLRLGVAPMLIAGSLFAGSGTVARAEPSLFGQATKAFDTAANSLAPPAKKQKASAKAKAASQGPAKRDNAQAAAYEQEPEKTGVKLANITATEPASWSPAEIELAKARCAQLLKGVDAVTLPETPIRKGACGTPAPVRLVSIGKNPEVAISPPALLTCDMVVGLHKWVKGDLQPLARKFLATDIIKVEVMSDYSCRLAYGRAGNKLSEHGKANALDIGGFMAKTGKTAYVLKEWGQTKRDVLAQIAAAKAAAEKADALRLQAEKKAQENLRDPKSAAPPDPPDPPAAVGSNSGAPAAGIAKTTIIDGVPKLTVTLPGGKPAGEKSKPQHLGGPKEAAGARAADPKKIPESNPARIEPKAAAKDATVPPLSATPPPPSTKTGLFLHAAHLAACRIFGTTLGPEANEAHRNHFHVDMAERKSTKICD